MKTLYIGIGIIFLACGIYTYQQVAAEQEAKEQAEPVQTGAMTAQEVVCSAKLRNLVEQREWRTKEPREQYREYQSYMGAGCLQGFHETVGQKAIRKAGDRWVPCQDLYGPAGAECRVKGDAIEVRIVKNAFEETR